MPTIEVVPLTTPQTSAPGWAYVLESTVPDPSRQPILAAGAARGKRAAARTATTALLSSHARTQAGRVRARLEELARDGPSSHAHHAGGGDDGDEAGPGTGGGAGNVGVADIVPQALRREMAEGRWKAERAGKMTTNVRRVLGSTKGWGHHAADEEVRVSGLGARESRGGDAGDAKRAEEDADDDGDVEMAGTDLAREPVAQTETKPEEVDESTAGVEHSHHPDPADADDDDDADEHEDDPYRSSDDDSEPSNAPSPRLAPVDALRLLRSPHPTYPSRGALAALLRAPPIPHSSAAAAPARDGAPRKFCDMCGHWGRARCTLCGALVCGVGCRATHDATEHPHR
jgi:zinc finger HIT domain-containing protein 1